MQVLEGLKKLTLGALQVPGEQSGKAVKRFKVVFAKPLDVARDFAAVLVPKSEADFQFLETALDDHLVFAGLGRREKKIMINAFEKTTVKKGAKIITQGDVGDYMYVILSGTVQFLVDGKDEGNASKGAVFGELALLYDCPRAATCKAETDCALFRVSQTTFRRIKASHVLQNDHETRTVLRNISIFQDLPPNYIHLLAESLFQKPFKKAEVLASKGAEATTFFIIKEGFVAGTDISIGTTKYANIRIGPGEFFGEGSIVAGTPLVGTVMALTDGTVYTLSKERFLRTLGHFDLRALAKKGQDTKLLVSAFLVALAALLSTMECNYLAN